MIKFIFYKCSNFNFNFFYLRIFTIRYSIYLFTNKLVFEKFLNYLKNNILLTFTTRKKYLQEKFRTKKEKLSRLKTWARKNENKLGTYKGFYIPANLPVTEQAKFFQKKRDEDEQKLWDKNFKFNEKISNIENQELNFEIEPTFANVQLQKLNYLANTEKKKHYTLLTNSVILSSQKNNTFYQNDKTISIWKFKNLNFRIKFSKKFLKSPIFPIKMIKNQHIWSYYNMGFNTTDFFNFFLIHYFPAYLVNFNFTKNKLLIVKKFKQLLSFDSTALKIFLAYKNIEFNNFNFVFSKTKLNLKASAFDGMFFFLKIFKNWLNNHKNKLFSINILINILLNAPVLTLSGKMFLQLASIIVDVFFFKKTKNTFLNTILIARLQGLISFSTIQNKNWRKYFSDSTFIASINNTFQIDFFKYFLKLKNNLFILQQNLINYSPILLLIENIFSNYNSILSKSYILQQSNYFYYLNKFTTIGYNLHNEYLSSSWNLTKTFFIFFKNWINNYEQLRFLFYTSFSQQSKIIDNFNVADVLFWFIIWKGKKLTARKVFFKFLKKFKKKYSLPPLLIFTHALLTVEPKIYLKTKKIAGKQYEIPIYISANWSKWIAIRWLLQAAKKRKRASITDSLSQEVWDACFKKGGAFSNKENLHLTVKRNKAYMWWF